MSAELASINGVIGDAAAAVIPATDDGLLRGDGAFEVARLYAGFPFALDEHFVRLAASAENLRLPYDEPALKSEVAAILAAHGSRDGCLRIVITRGGNRVLLTEPLPDRGTAVRLATIAYQSTIVLDGIKSLSYAGNMLAGRVAVEKGADEALLVTPEGMVLEAPTATFFWVEGGNVFTPPLADRILESITRRYIFQITGAVEKSILLPDLLANADEAFLASTTREIQAVNGIDQREFPANGAVTAELAGRLSELVGSALPTDAA
ncbi:MAG: aminotransferase class IV [Solirubrobacterales bacterium]|nr:aminotransferase class IV [Solirubrobacterales bacterium]